jgi:hypothetical protein
MSDDHYFTCPKCGGHYCGRDTRRELDGSVTILPIMFCHNATDGTGMSETFEEQQARIKAGIPPKRMCKWHGPWPLKESTK